jgi:hypothetical protein
MKNIRLTKHALEQCDERGATEAEIKKAINEGTREPAKYGRKLCCYNFAFNDSWQGNFYAIK